MQQPDRFLLASADPYRPNRRRTRTQAFKPRMRLFLRLPVPCGLLFNPAQEVALPTLALHAFRHVMSIVTELRIRAAA